MRNRNRLAGLFLVVTTLLAVFAFTSSAVQAAETQQEVCYEQVEQPTYGDVIEKETRTRYWVEGTEGQHYSLKGNSGLEKDDVPAFPAPYWQANTHQEPHNHATWLGVEGEGLHYTSNESNGKRDWFYFTPGTKGYWGEWSDWTDWPGAGPVNDDGRDRGPAFHGKGKTDGVKWEREYRYVVVGEYQNGTEWVSVEIECPPVVTTVPPTTEPPVTTVPPTAPPTTEPPVTTPPHVETTTTTVVVATDLPPVPPTQPPAAPPTGDLPATGSSTTGIFLAGLASIVLGALALAATRRKTTI